MVFLDSFLSLFQNLMVQPSDVMMSTLPGVRTSYKQCPTSLGAPVPL